MDTFFRKLELIKKEDFIWLVYYFIITAALVSNSFEKNYLITNNKKSLNTVKKINTTILIIAFLIYLFFVVLTFENFDILKNNGTRKDIRLANERLILNILFLVAGAYAIYVDYDSNTPSTDIGIF